MDLQRFKETSNKIKEMLSVSKSLEQCSLFGWLGV